MLQAIDDGGPAFPKTGNYADGQMAPYDSIDQVGMSLRDYYIGQVAAGWLASYEGCATHPAAQKNGKALDDFCRCCVATADALIAARKAVSQ